MVAFEDALKCVLKTSQVVGTETVSLDGALNRVLAQDVYADLDMPPFLKSAVDGYACRKADLESPLAVKEVIRAGSIPQYRLTRGECSKIMTGAMVPEGADLVIMVEHTETVSEGVIRWVGTSSASNICSRGEDIRFGDKVLVQGTLIQPAHIAVLASVGCNRPLVYEQPIVAVISTGDELVEPNATPGQAQIRNSNGAQLVAQITAMNARPLYLGIVPDREAETKAMIESALQKARVVILSGGVSMGDFDFVPAIMQQLGVQILFDSIAVQPGRPTVFGVRNDRYLFGLPGNPVSSFVLFELLVKPLIYAVTGRAGSQPVFKLPLAVDYSRKNAQRRAFVPVVLDQEGGVSPIAYHGSAHIHAYVAAQGIMSIPPNVTDLKKGELVDVRPL